MCFLKAPYQRFSLPLSMKETRRLTSPPLPLPLTPSYFLGEHYELPLLSDRQVPLGLVVMAVQRLFAGFGFLGSVVQEHHLTLSSLQTLGFEPVLWAGSTPWLK